ncbi:DUF3168 domain-containing protein [Prevotella intermedia]|jgi:hypothetical protein|uniref:DUF3168 domain-containing protein n=1 Tax=Prevotella intermedia TaxID=28131 RepID=A0AAJ3RHN4_PREIN|nr:DUF3168 domain-containing protein [Prevotella intermedia]PIK16936.1 hypothetical protein CTI16_12120 [Prevotella intermedia]PJI22410.1 hypothetical protein CTM45_03325 [Prevotella intermedia]
MISSLQIGKVIYTLLDVDFIHKVVGNKIYPLIADATTTYPFIMYRRTGLIPENNKDYTNESVLCEVFVIADNYKESVELAELVRKALEHKSGLISGIDVEDIILEDCSEEYIDNSFL